MSRMLMLLIELLIVTVAIFLADVVQNTVNFIPKSIIHLPSVDYTRADFYTVLKYFLVCHSLVFIFSAWKLGVWSVQQAQRTSDEIFTLMFAFSLSMLLVFVTTSIAFDPNFMVAIGLISGVLFVLLYLVASRAPIGLLGALGKRLWSIPGVLILVFALSPGLLAKMFVSDRDTANVITQIRIYFSDNSGDNAFTLRNALGNRQFKQPMLVKNVPGQAQRIVVLERAGRLLSLDYPSGENLKTEIDIRAQVGKAEVENGALGYAFHPQFGQAGSDNASFIYLYYTTVQAGQQVNRLARFDLSTTPATELSLMMLGREASGFHNGGSLEFGPDGYLYIALGEGVHTAQATSQAKTLRGGILRIDVDCGANSQPIKQQPVGSSSAHYCIPIDNPFVQQPALMDEYWAIGLRNPFRMSFDPASGDLWVGDVGSTKWEEVNLIHKGGDYQFPYIEGHEKTSRPSPELSISREYGPLYTYVHTAYDRAVIGGIVYQGTRFPELKNQYLFADNYSSKIFLMPATGEAVDSVSLVARANQYAQRGVSSVTQLTNGDIIVTTLGRSSAATGEVLKFSREAAASPDNLPDAGKEEPVDAAEAKQIYITNCARCHGFQGRGDGPDADVLGVPFPDFTASTFQASRSDATLTQVITHGGTAKGLSPMMPPWGVVLSTTEIDALVAYVRGLDGAQ